MSQPAFETESQNGEVALSSERPRYSQFALQHKFSLFDSSFYRFVLVGGSSFIVDASLYFLLIEFVFTGDTGAAQFARAIAMLVGLLLTWIGHRYYSFGKRKQLSAKAQFKWVALVAACSITVNFIGFSLMHTLLPQHTLASLFSLGFGVGLGLVVNWLGANYLTYRHVVA
ncbi:GtrA family protein [Shewanella maritima]|uniref:GtrA family protein n=1 Tax=Shewanella maritima TaxID=2520507 RepID=A0A411PD30_9GAMM|nr:GtrA family protein [Shewanella maritima]QBF81507.1 GtrA family protein [Shewanella maritima]